MAERVYDLFVQEVDRLTISATANAVTVVGQLTRAVKRAQNTWDALYCCGHGSHMLVEGVRYGFSVDHETSEPCAASPGEGEQR